MTPRTLSTLFVCATLAAVALAVPGHVFAHADNNDPNAIHACMNPQGHVRIVGEAGSCNGSETPVHWAAAGPPASAGGGKLVFQHDWESTSTASCCNAWHTVPGSTVTATTSGGPLMITMNVYLVNGSHGACQPIIDGVWAGSYGGYANPSDPYWKEGLIAVGCCGGGWRAWTKSRVYVNVPAGPHTFAIQCATDGGTMQVNSSANSSSWSIVELPQP